MLAIKQKNSSWLIDLLFIGTLLSIFYAIFIGKYALFTPDEGRYSEVAREMVASHDYVTPRLDGVAFLDKPALYYWLQAIAIQLFGIKEWALRFWPACLGVLGSLMAYVIGRTLYTRRAALLSAVILATSPLYYGAAHYANLDLEVSVLISITLGFSLLGLQASSPRQQKIFFLLAYVFAGLAILTKGLIGLAFPVMIIGSWILLLNRWSVLKKMHLFLGLLLIAGIALPWYFLVQKANPEFLHFFFITQQVARFLTHGDYNNRTVWWFYIPIVLLGTIPWSAFFVQAFTNNLKLTWQNRQQHANELFLVLWFSLIFVFFSIPTSKTVGYILPVFMPLALMVGNYLDTTWGNLTTKGFARGIKLLIVGCVVAGFGCLLATRINKPDIIYPGSAPYLITAALIFLADSVAIAYFYRKKQFIKVIASLIVFSMFGLLSLLNSTTIMNQRTIKPIAQQIKPLLQPDAEVVTFLRYYQDLAIYLERRITIVADWHDSDIAKNDNWQRELWYGMPFQDTQDWLIEENTFWQRWQSQKHLIVIMNTKNYSAFVSKAGASLHQLGKKEDVVWVSNY